MSCDFTCDGLCQDVTVTFPAGRVTVILAPPESSLAGINAANTLLRLLYDEIIRIPLRSSVSGGDSKSSPAEYRDGVAVAKESFRDNLAGACWQSGRILLQRKSKALWSRDALERSILFLRDKEPQLSLQAGKCQKHIGVDG